MYTFTNVSAGYNVSIEVVWRKKLYIVFLRAGNLPNFFFKRMWAW